MELFDLSHEPPNTGTNMIKKNQEHGQSSLLLKAFLHEGDVASISSTSINGENKIKSIILSKRRQPSNCSAVNNLEGSTDNEDDSGVIFTRSFHRKADQSHVLKEFYLLNDLFPFQVDFKLLYRASDHHFSVEKFHELCDYETNTITLCKTKGNQIIGGYTPLNWAEEYSENKTYFKTDKDNETFLFSLTKNEKYPLTKTKKNKAICCFRNWGPTFGGGYDLQIGDKADQSSNSASYFPRSFVCPQKSATQKHLTGSKNKEFKILEWEVYKVIKKTTNKQEFKDLKPFKRRESFLNNIKNGIFDIFSSHSDKKENNSETEVKL